VRGTGEIPLPRTIAITRIAKRPFLKESDLKIGLRKLQVTEVTIRSPLRKSAIAQRSFECLSGESKPPVKLGKPAASKCAASLVVSAQTRPIAATSPS